MTMKWFTASDVSRQAKEYVALGCDVTELFEIDIYYVSVSRKIFHLLIN
jgi:hypothetical protein